MCWGLRLHGQTTLCSSGSKPEAACDNITVANAAEHGHPDLLKWCYGQHKGYDWPSNLPVYKPAAANGELLGPNLDDPNALS